MNPEALVLSASRQLVFGFGCSLGKTPEKDCFIR